MSTYLDSEIKDKFGMITTIPRNKLEKGVSNFSSYFENKIISKNTILSSDKIYQLNWLLVNSEEEIFNTNVKKIRYIISSHYKNYIRKVKNEFRLGSKRNTLFLHDIIYFIEDFNRNIRKYSTLFSLINKRLYPKKIFTNETNKKKDIDKSFIDEEVTSIISGNLLTDYVFTTIIKKSIVKFNDYEELGNIKKFYYHLKKIGKYNSKLIDWYENFFSDIFTDNIPQILYPLKNIYSEIHRFNDTSLYLSDITRKYHFINNKEVFVKIRSNFENIFMNILRIDKENVIENSRIIISFLKANIRSISNLILSNDKIIWFMTNIFDILPKTHDGLYTMIDYYSTINNILRNINSKLFNEYILIINKNITQVIDNRECINIIISLLDSNLDNYEYTENIIKLGSKLKNKDIFINELKRYFILKLLNTENNKIIITIDRFKKIYTSIESCFKPVLTKSIKKILFDFDVSYKINCNYSKVIKDNVNFIVSSHDVWDININEGHIVCDDAMYKSLEKYRRIASHYMVFNTFYSRKYNDKRYLILYPHLGKLDMTFHSNNQETRLIMLPIQGIVLDQFVESSDEYTIGDISINKMVLFDKIKSIVSYSDKFVRDVIDSLINDNILIDDDDNIIMNVNYEGLTEVNLIRTFYNISDIETKWEEKRKIELAHSRLDILSTVINSILKHTGNSSGAMFKDEIISSLETFDLFPITSKLVDKTLESMIKRDYIFFDNKTGYEKIYY
jgi:hypothetical protein